MECSMTVVSVFTLLLCISDSVVSNLYIKTNGVSPSVSSSNRLKEYGYTPASPLVINVKSCSGAIVYLLTSDASTYYQITIQGYSNTKSEIHLTKQSTTARLGQVSLTNILKCNEYVQFRISWINNEIKLERHIVCAVWLALLATSGDSSITANDITDIGVMSSTASHWKIHTPDNDLVLKTPNAAQDNYLSDYDYHIHTSSSVELSLKTCEFVVVKLYSEDLTQLGMFDIRKSSIITTNTNGAVSTVTASSSCTAIETYKISWAQYNFRLRYVSSDGKSSDVAIGLQGSKRIQRISFRGPISVIWKWKTDAVGSCFSVICGASCDFTTTAVAETTTTTAATTTTVPETTTVAETTTTAPETTTTVLETTTTVHETTTTKPTTTTQLSTTSTQTDTSTLTASTADATSTISQYSFTTFSTARNACCCIPYDLIKAPVDIFSPPVITKKETNKFKRSLTSATDNRPSAKFIGYTGSGFLLFIFFGIVIIDIPNLLKMLKTIKRNLSSGLRTRKIKPA